MSGVRDLDPALGREPFGDIAASGELLEVVTGWPVTPRVPDDAVKPRGDLHISLAKVVNGRSHGSHFRRPNCGFR